MLTEVLIMYTWSVTKSRRKQIAIVNLINVVPKPGLARNISRRHEYYTLLVQMEDPGEQCMYKHDMRPTTQCHRW